MFKSDTHKIKSTSHSLFSVRCTCSRSISGLEAELTLAKDKRKEQMCYGVLIISKTSSWVFYLRCLILSSKISARKLQLCGVKMWKIKKWEKNEESCNSLQKLALFAKHLLARALPLLFPPVGMARARILHGRLHLISWLDTNFLGSGSDLPYGKLPPSQLFCPASSWVCCCPCTSHNKTYFLLALLCLSLPTEAHSYETGVMCILFPSLSPEQRVIA